MGWRLENEGLNTSEKVVYIFLDNNGCEKSDFYTKLFEKNQFLRRIFYLEKSVEITSIYVFPLEK